MTINYGQGEPGSPSKGYQLYITALVMVLVAAIFVALRLATRFSHKALGMDDYMITVSLVCSVLLTATVNLAVVHGYGKRSDDIETGELRTALRWFFIAQVFYKLVLGFSKVSILCLYRRIFVSSVFQRVCEVALALVAIWAFSCIMATILQCIPLEASWNKNVDAKCIDKDAFWYGFAVTNTATDFILFALPIQPVLKLHLHWKERLGVLGVFALGLFVCITSIVRTTAVAQTVTGDDERDITWDFIPRSTWTLIEANTGIICACLPILKGPLIRLFPRLLRGSTNRSKGRYASSSARNSYPLNQYSGKTASFVGAGDSEVTSTANAGKGAAVQGSKEVGSEESSVGMIEEERRSDRSTEGILTKTNVTIVYEDTRGQPADSFR